jgi:curved DNA-binding protein CbpA
MNPPSDDPYRTLGVRPSVSDRELRAAYRRLVQQHHPDHNSGSAESARRFEEIQAAYARIRQLRDSGPRHAQTTADPGLEARLAEMERELREAKRASQEAEAARQAREQAAREARQAAASALGGTGDDLRGQRDEGTRRRPTDEELGYVHTDDSFTQILSDARDELSERFSRAREHPVAKRLSDLIDELDDFAKRTDHGHRRDRDK